jgi:hypothetical protein
MMEGMNDILSKIIGTVSGAGASPHAQVDALRQKQASLLAKRSSLADEIKKSETDSIAAETNGGPFDWGHLQSLRSRTVAVSVALDAIGAALREAEQDARRADIAAFETEAAQAVESLNRQKTALSAHILAIFELAKGVQFDRTDVLALWETLPLSAHPLSEVRAKAASLGLDPLSIQVNDAPRAGHPGVVADLLKAREMLRKFKVFGPLIERSEQDAAAQAQAAANAQAGEQATLGKRAERQARYSAALARAAADWFRAHQPVEVITDGEIYKLGHALTCELRQVIPQHEATTHANRWAVRASALVADHGLSGIRTWHADRALVCRALGLEVQS